MNSTTSAPRRFALQALDRRVDLVASADGSLRQVIAAAGVSFVDGRHAVITKSGRDVSVDSSILGIEDGTLLTVVDLVAGTGKGRGRGRANAARVDHHSLWWLLATASALLAALALGDLAAGSPLFEDRYRVVAAVALGMGALLASSLWIARSPRTGLGASLALAAASLLAFAAGVVAVPQLERAAHLAVLIGLLAMAVMSALLGVVAREGVMRAVAGTVTAVALLVAAVWALTLSMGWSMGSAAAISLGLAVPGIRFVPAVLLNLDEGYSINYTHFMSSRWTVRGAVPADPGIVTMSMVRPHIDESAARMRVGTVVLSLLAVLMTPLTLTQAVGGSLLVRIGAIAAVASTVIALALIPRKSQGPVLRWVPRAAAAAICLQAAVGMASGSGDAARLIAALSLLLVALVSAALIVPVGRGTSSLVWSRTADIIESMAVVLALPTSLLAANVLESVREMMAG